MKSTTLHIGIALVALTGLCATATAGFEVLEAHGQASAQIGDGPAILDEDWGMPLEVSAFAGGPTGIVAGTGSTFNVGNGFSGITTAQVNAWDVAPALLAGSLMDFSFVVDGDVSASLAVDIMLLTNGDAFGNVSLLLQDLTDDLTLMAWQQSTGETSIESVLDLQQDHTYQFVVTANAGTDGAGLATAQLSFQMLLPAPGALALLGLGAIAPGRRRRR